MFPPNGTSKKGDYSQISLNDFSDDDSDDGDNNHFSNNSRSNGNHHRSHHDDENGADYASSSMRRQQLQLQQQDQGLEMLSQSAERLGKMSMAISEELGFQNQILDDMDTDLEEANQNLDFVTRKTKEFIEKSGGTRNFMLILVLSLIAIVLFFLILYT